MNTKLLKHSVMLQSTQEENRLYNLYYAVKTNAVAVATISEDMKKTINNYVIDYFKSIQKLGDDKVSSTHFVKHYLLTN
jgi:hypothetical protein